MTDERSKRASALYLDDEEIYRRLGVGEKVGRLAIQRLEAKGFPRRDPVFANRRYWPAVRAFLDARHGLTMSQPPSTPDGEERPFDDPED